MAEGDDERVRLGYETAEVGRRPVVRVTAVAIGVSALFVATALMVAGPGPGPDVAPEWFLAWLAFGMLGIALLWRVRRRVESARPGDRRVVRWASVLLAVGLVVGVLGWVDPLMLHSRSRPTPNRVKCASNMKQIGSAILLYSNDNGGRYPGRLEELLETQDISVDVFVCPSTDDQPATGATTRALTDGLTAGGHLSYVYLGAGLTSQCDPDTVVLYEPLTNHAGQGMNVLFGDGHVDFLWVAEAREILDRVAAGERPVVWKGPGVRAARPTTKGG